MKFKLLSFGIFLLFIFVSCNKVDDLNKPTGEIVEFKLDILPLLDIEESPITRQNHSGLYAINVLWKGTNQGASFEPYATGLFNDVSNVRIGLIEGYDYRFDCSFLRDDELPYSENGKYGVPFSKTPDGKVDGVITNKLHVSIAGLWENQNFYQHIYSGATQINATTIEARPANHRFFGSGYVDFKFNQGQPLVCHVELQRAYYTLAFSCRDLESDEKLRLEVEDFEPFELTGQMTSTRDRLMVLKRLSDRYNGNLFADEELTMNIKYQKVGESEWKTIYEGAKVKVKRDSDNLIKIVNIRDHISSTSIRLNGDDSLGGPTNVNEQELKL